MALEEFTVGYPIDFRSGGDTTKQFAAKTIQEVARIYDYMNALRVGMTDQTAIDQALATARSELESHRTSTNPHPNWSVNLTGQTTGNLDASRVAGKLTNATIDYGKVNGLASYVSELSHQGITSSNYESGVNRRCYVTFENSFTIQFGSLVVDKTTAQTSQSGTAITVQFDKLFTSIYAVIPVIRVDLAYSTNIAEDNAFVQLIDYDQYQFRFIIQFAHGEGTSGLSSQYFVNWIALGVC